MDGDQGTGTVTGDVNRDGPMANSGSMWILRTTDDPDPLMFRLLPGAVKTIGRAARADFIVDRALVSRLHCRLTLSAAGTLLLEDLESTNGTFLNGERVERTPVSPGDLIKVGRVEFVAKPAGQGA